MKAGGLSHVWQSFDVISIPICAVSFIRGHNPPTRPSTLQWEIMLNFVVGVYEDGRRAHSLSRTYFLFRLIQKSVPTQLIDC